MSLENGFQDLTVGHCNPKGNLDYLPAELFLQILTRLPDLTSLDSVLRASPTAYRVFDSYAVEITEAVLSSGYICGHVRVIFRIVALLRSGTLPIRGLPEFKERVIRDAMRYASRVRKSPEGFAPEKLDNNTKPAIIRSILATARQITWASLDCLTIYLNNFRTLRPEHSIDKKYTFWSNECPKSVTIPWESRCPGRKVDVQDIGAPSWTEEQRSIRAFWRLQLINDLKQAARSCTLHWPEEDLATLKETAAVSIPNDWEPQAESFRAKHFGAKFGTNWKCFFKLDFYHPKVHEVYAQSWYGPPPEYAEIISVIDYIREVYGQKAAHDVADGQRSLSELQGLREVQRAWPLPGPMGKEWFDLVHPSKGAEYYMRVPFGYLEFETFGRYGFAFWSERRMCAYGLYPTNSSPYQGHIEYAWRSILTTNDITRIERARKES